MKWWIGGWLVCVAAFFASMWRAGQRRAALAPTSAKAHDPPRREPADASAHPEHVS